MVPVPDRVIGRIIEGYIDDRTQRCTVGALATMALALELTDPDSEWSTVDWLLAGELRQLVEAAGPEDLTP